MSRIKVLNTELELDMMDVDVVERFETLTLQLAQDVQNPFQETKISASERLRIVCALVDKYFDEMFGAGTAVRVFGEHNNNWVQRVEAFAQVSQSTQQLKSEMDDILNRYSVQPPPSPASGNQQSAKVIDLARHPGNNRHPGRKQKRKGGRR